MDSTVEIYTDTVFLGSFQVFEGVLRVSMDAIPNRQQRRNGAGKPFQMVSPCAFKSTSALAISAISLESEVV
jgi:hypothetical protein